jgi:hypothetical protein
MGWGTRGEEPEMTTCKAVERDLDKLAALRPVELPDWVRSHVAGCPGCNRRLAAARLARGFVISDAEPIAPPQGFTDRVRTALVSRPEVRRPEPDVWRPAWGLLPTFAAAVVALFIVYQASENGGPTGLFPTEGLSAGEQLVLDTSAPDVDAVLAAVLEGVAK